MVLTQQVKRLLLRPASNCLGEFVVNSAKSFEISHTATETLQIVTEPVIEFWEEALSITASHFACTYCSCVT